MSDCEIHSRSGAAIVGDRVHLRSELRKEQRGDALAVGGAGGARLVFPRSAGAGVSLDQGSTEPSLSPDAARVSAGEGDVWEGDRSKDGGTRGGTRVRRVQYFGGQATGEWAFRSDGVRFSDAGAGGKGERGGAFSSSGQSAAADGSFSGSGSEEEAVPPQSKELEAPSGSVRGECMHGFEVGDMVWGKVKSHPWWPGHIFNEAFASSSVRRTKREGHVLVAFFGDSSYGWFDPTELVHFDPYYAEKSRQTASRNFSKAVEEAVDEASRRCALATSCYCRNPTNFRPAAAPGYFAVDVAGYEPGGVYSSKQIKGVRDNFVAADVLSFVNQLALRRQDPEPGSIDWIKQTATILALRKAMFEEFDVTYAEAFGVKPVIPSRTAQGGSDQAERVPSRAAPLSGPLVIAESLAERKAPGRAVVRAKDTAAKKNKYLFKRREEATPPAAASIKKSSSPPPSVAGTKQRLLSLSPPVTSLPPPDLQYGDGRLPQSSVPRHPPQVEAPNVHYLPDGKADVIVAAAGSGGYAEADVGNYVLQKRVPEKQQQSIPKKEESYQAAEPSGRGPPVQDVDHVSDVRRPKTEQPVGEELGERVPPVHEAAATAKMGPSDHGSKNFHHEYHKPAVDAKEAVGLLKRPGVLSDQGSDGNNRERARKRPREDEEIGEKKKKRKKKEEAGVNHHPPLKHRKDGESLVRVSSSGRTMANASIGLANNHSDNSVAAEVDGSGSNSYAPSDSATTIIQLLPKLDWASHALDLPGVLGDLSALALDPFYGAERDAATLVRHVLLRFRSLVYEKALPFPPSAEHAGAPEPSPHPAAKYRAGRPPQEGGRDHAGIAGERESREQQRESAKPSTSDLKPVFQPVDPAKMGRRRMPSDRQEERLAKRLKKLEKLKALTCSAEKKGGVGNKTPDLRVPSQKDAGAAPAASPPVKTTVKSDSLKKQEAPVNPPKAAIPTFLVMKFPQRTTLPSVSSLKARFARFGPLDLSGTRVFWKSYTCRVLFKHRADAQAACSYAQGNDIFGQVKVNYFVRELEPPVSEPTAAEPVKRQADDAPQLRPPGGGDPATNEPRPPAAAKHQNQNQFFLGQQLKSILKKPSADDAAAPAGGGGVTRETQRVKFMLGGDEDATAPLPVTSSAAAPVLLPTPALLDLNNNRKTPKSVAFLPPLQSPLQLPPRPQDGIPLLPLPPPVTRDMLDTWAGPQSVARAPPLPLRYGEMEVRERGGVDISHQMLSLLIRCNDIVANVKSALGYVPYHPL